MICIRLAFEIFHYVEKSIINVWLVVKLHLDLVEIGESILKRSEISATEQWKQASNKVDSTAHKNDGRSPRA